MTATFDLARAESWAQAHAYTAARRRRFAKTCRKAADEITKRGLAKGEFVRKNGKCCTLGALRLALAPDSPIYLGDLFVAPYRDLANLLSEVVDVRVEVWNDRKATTAEDAIALLRGVADVLDPR